jgi:uncharacterized protein YndB with AHSA1/START domain
MAATAYPSLEIKRQINASRDRVYAAWTDPAQLKKWFGPENVKTRNLIADARVGGQFRWDLTDQEGKEITISGGYRELEPGKKIVFTWRLEEDEDWKNHSSIVTVEFFDRQGGTEIPLTHEKLPNEASRDDHTQGEISQQVTVDQKIRKEMSTEEIAKKVEVHSFTANGPFVGHDRLVVQFDADVTDKNSKQRRKLSEVGVYTVKNGKIVREEFLPRV